jgi:hypothetical protein
MLEPLQEIDIRKTQSTRSSVFFKHARWYTKGCTINFKISSLVIRLSKQNDQIDVFVPKVVKKTS